MYGLESIYWSWKLERVEDWRLEVSEREREREREKEYSRYYDLSIVTPSKSFSRSSEMAGRTMVRNGGKESEVKWREDRKMRNGGKKSGTAPAERARSNLISHSFTTTVIIAIQLCPAIAMSTTVSGMAATIRAATDNETFDLAGHDVSRSWS